MFMLVISLHFYVRLLFRFYNFVNERFCGMVKLVNAVSYYSITFSFPVDITLCFSFIWGSGSCVFLTSLLLVILQYTLSPE